MAESSTLSPGHIAASDSGTLQVPKLLVEQGYDQIAPRYLEWAISHSSPRLKYLHKLLELLPEKSNVLELGCGAGVPCTQLLAQSHHVIGNDISAAQIELAKKHIPNAEFVKGDMMDLEFAKGEVGAVVAFYSIIHLPREEQGLLLKRIWGWLDDDGLLLLNLGARDEPGTINEDVRTISYLKFLEPVLHT